jgi:hypothetical protein
MKTVNFERAFSSFQGVKFECGSGPFRWAVEVDGAKLETRTVRVLFALRADCGREAEISFIITGTSTVLTLERVDYSTVVSS